MTGSPLSLVAAMAGLALAATPLPAQRVARDEPPDEQQQQPQQIGHTARSAAGEVGQRQTRDQIAPNFRPLARIDSRINNRVQNRIRSRIDRDYDPQANAADPFAIAEDRTRDTRPRR